MSFLDEPFEHDLFVSYSHGDFDNAGTSKLKTWCQAFVRELEDELRLNPKFRDIRIFLDEDHRQGKGVDPTESLTPQLKDHISASGLLAILMSPDYLTSDWCGTEREWWLDAQREHGVPADGRIIVARFWPTEEVWPDVLVDEGGAEKVGFFFYDRARPDRPWPYGWPKPTPDTGGEFRDVLHDMVGRVWHRLSRLREELEARRKQEEDAQKLAGGGQLVYLHARADHADMWERVRDALQAHDFAVVPGEPERVALDPAEENELAKQRVRMLRNCDGLLLVGTENGRALDEDLVVVGRGQRHRARDQGGRLLPCSVLDTAALAATTPSRLQTARRLDIQWIDTSNEGWPRRVRRWMHECSAKVA